MDELNQTECSVKNNHSNLVGILLLFLLYLVCLPGAGLAADSEFLVGWAHDSITPDQPVALSGQFHTRISEYVHDPVTATAVAIETRLDGEVVDQAIMVSCDLVAIRGGLQERLRAHLHDRLPGFEIQKLFLNATHTHTGPVLRSGIYELPEEGVMKPADYMDFLVHRLGEMVTRAWQQRKSSGVSWGLGHAVVGHNRRAVYYSGEARMYGDTSRNDFSHIEGYEDHAVELLYFWDTENELVGIAINIACPSQEVEGASYLSADFWHDVRVLLKEAYSEDLFIFPMTGASGDQSPHLMFRKNAEEERRRRKGVSRTEEIAERIVRAVTSVTDSARQEIDFNPAFRHLVETVNLPIRRVTNDEYARARDQVSHWQDPSNTDRRRHRQLLRHTEVVERYEKQDEEPSYPVEVHAVRLGDTAILTNPFELFLDFGIQMQARSPAELTFVVQLTGEYGGYLPTARAVQAGGYGAEIESNYVGPEGGKVLVDRSVALADSLFEAQ